MTDISTGARRYLELRARKDALDAELKEVKAEIETLAGEMIDAMDDAGLESFAAEGHSFFIRTSLKASLAAEHFDAFRARLDEHGCSDIVKPTINARTLESFVREQAADNGGEVPDWIGEIVGVYYKNDLSVRKR